MKNGCRSFNAEMAMEIGLNEAIFFSQMEYWMRKAKGRVINGQKWIFFSYEQLAEQFPFWSISTIQRIMVALKERSLIETKKEYELMKSQRSLLHLRILKPKETPKTEQKTQPDSDFCKSQNDLKGSPPNQIISQERPTLAVNLTPPYYNTNTTTQNNNRDYIPSVPFEPENKEKEGIFTPREKEEKLTREFGKENFAARKSTARYVGGQLSCLYEKAHEWLRTRSVCFQSVVKDYIESNMALRVVRNKIAYAKTILIEVWKKCTGQKHNTSFDFDEEAFEAAQEEHTLMLERRMNLF